MSDYNLDAMLKLHSWLSGQMHGNRTELDIKSWFSLPKEGDGECGTMMCMAGWTVSSEGWEPDLSDPFIRVDGLVHRAVLNGDPETSRRVPEIAQEILGLGDEEASFLFAEHYSDEPWAESVAERFLDHLIRRARDGKGAMTGDEVCTWYVGALVLSAGVPLPFSSFGTDEATCRSLEEENRALRELLAANGVEVPADL